VGRQSLKVLKVDVKVSFNVLWPYFFIEIMLKINRERRKMRKISVLGIKNHKSAAVSVDPLV